jgi:hypothetical protein
MLNQRAFLDLSISHFSRILLHEFDSSCTYQLPVPADDRFMQYTGLELRTSPRFARR